MHAPIKHLLTVTKLPDIYRHRRLTAARRLKTHRIKHQRAPRRLQTRVSIKPFHILPTLRCRLITEERIYAALRMLRGRKQINHVFSLFTVKGLKSNHRLHTAPKSSRIPDSVLHHKRHGLPPSGQTLLTDFKRLPRLPADRRRPIRHHQLLPAFNLLKPENLITSALHSIIVIHSFPIYHFFISFFFCGYILTVYMYDKKDCYQKFYLEIIY